MTTAAQLRKAALAQDGAEQVEVGPTRGWAVAGTVFAALVDDGHAALSLGIEQRTRMAGELSGVETTSSGVRVDLAAINGMALNHWVHEAWLHCAPADLAAAWSTASRAADEGEDDLGRIGAPARRALHGAGIGSLDALASRDRDEVAALHGVGPRAVALLADALADRGVRW
jgi:hypothetical protein